MPDQHVLLVGAGYVGSALARELHARDINCTALVASKSSEERLRNRVSTVRLDLDSATLPLALPPCTDLVYLVPPRRNSDRDERLTLLLSGLPSSVQTVLYASTSGVYGDHEGRVVDEETATTPHSARAQRRLVAEQIIEEFARARGINRVTARIPGIYGPGRLPLQSIRDGQPVIRSAEANPGNRVHRDDLAYALAELLRHARGAPAGTLHETYNAGDNCHINGTEFALEVARQAGLDAPPQISREKMKATASSVRWSFLAESRRLDSRKLERVLQRPFIYSDPIDGIRASLAEGDDPAA